MLEHFWCIKSTENAEACKEIALINRLFCFALSTVAHKQPDSKWSGRLFTSTISKFFFSKCDPLKPTLLYRPIGKELSLQETVSIFLKKFILCQRKC